MDVGDLNCTIDLATIFSIRYLTQWLCHQNDCGSNAVNIFECSFVEFLNHKSSHSDSTPRVKFDQKVKSSLLWMVLRFFLELGSIFGHRKVFKKSIRSLKGHFQVKLSLEIQFIDVEIVKQSQKYIYVAHALKHRFMSTARITKSLQLLEIRNIDVIVV